MHDTLRHDAAPTAAAIATAPRFDLYLLIHKALRLFYGDTLARLGSVDVGDAAALDAALAQAESLLDLLQKHYGHEDRFVHPVLERVQPGCTTRIEAEHAAHVESLDAMCELALVVRASAGRTRDIALSRLYASLARCMAADFEHMHFEDVEFNAILWRHCTDAELMAVEGDLVASIAPATMALALRWMLLAANPSERAAFLAGARQGMPPEAFAGVLGLAQQALPAAEWNKLAQALGVS